MEANKQESLESPGHLGEEGRCRCHAAEPEQAEAPAYVYALGRIDLRIPSLSVEKELVQASAAAGGAGSTDREALTKALADRGNRYLRKRTVSRVVTC